MSAKVAVNLVQMSESGVAPCIGRSPVSRMGLRTFL
jgi:hypothetical protein